MLKSICKLACLFERGLAKLAPLGDLFIRFWVARVFFKAGLTKIATWQSTVLLFTYEYKVPLLSPYWAAAIGTGVELVVPALLLLGLFGRLPAFILFFFNIISVVSYPYLLTEDGRIGLNDHIYWGILLMVIMLHGPGKLALDTLIKKLFCKKSNAC
ncbi:MAG: hypothetical protein Tsb005_10450 [Gammaproteobacteria bacterium]